jgi:methyl-accepting chemotaxis protein
MTGERSIITKTAIEEYINEITRYVNNFEVKSAKDEQALSDILLMVKGISERIDSIEAAHQKRIKLTQELESKLAELETVVNEFAVKDKA